MVNKSQNKKQIVHLNNGFKFIFNDDNEWVYKALPIKPKKKIAEDPQFKVIDDIEGKYKKDFDNCLGEIVKDVARYLLK